MENFNPANVVQHQSQVSAGATTVEASRAVAETQAKILVAKSFPRDMASIKIALSRECSELSVSNGAFYSFGRGSSMANGLSIRAAEMLARCFTNFDYGVVELSRVRAVKDGKGGIAKPGESEMMAFAWDVENNVRKELKFTVTASRDTRNGSKNLEAERDVYENNANLGTRRLRNCILALIPAELKDLTEQECKKTLAGNTAKSLPQRAEQMILSFDSIGVSREMIEGKIGHAADNINQDDLALLAGVWQAIRDGEKVAQHFDLKKAEKESNGEINNKGDFDINKIG